MYLQYSLSFHDLQEIVEDIAENVRESQGDHYNFFEDIVADLNNFTISRAVNDTKNNFFENICKVYGSGYLPCGWYGDYPNGGIIAYKA
ncbi:hypothetical protein [Priestia aryabhattai]|uniref:hypothetical protein n=1 Tax=Priestia aryabhattai TaxID=412384 RepID=UPI003D817EC8